MNRYKDIQTEYANLFSFIHKYETGIERRSALVDLVDTIINNPDDFFVDYLQQKIRAFNRSADITQIGNYPSQDVTLSNGVKFSLVCLGDHIAFSVPKR